MIYQKINVKKMSDKTVVELKAEARLKKIKGFSKMNRAQLCEALGYKNCGKRVTKKTTAAKKTTTKKTTPKNSPKKARKEAIPRSNIMAETPEQLAKMLSLYGGFLHERNKKFELTFGSLLWIMGMHLMDHKNRVWKKQYEADLDKIVFPYTKIILVGTNSDLEGNEILQTSPTKDGFTLRNLEEAISKAETITRNEERNYWLGGVDTSHQFLEQVELIGIQNGIPVFELFWAANL